MRGVYARAVGIAACARDLVGMGLARGGDMYNSHGDKPPLPSPPAWTPIQAGQSTRFVCRSRRLRPREREREHRGYKA